MNMETMKKGCARILFGIALCLTLSLGFCSMQAEAAPKLNKKTATITVGKTVKLKVKGTKKKVKWSSSKKSVCTVNKSGTVKGIKKGTATIKAKVAKKTLKCKVTVKAKKSTKPNQNPNPPAPTTVTPTGLTVTGPFSKIAPGGTMQLQLGYSPANAERAAVKWSTSNSRRATVTDTGLVTATGTGEVTITAELQSNWRINGKFTFMVENLAVEGTVNTADGGDLLLTDPNAQAVYSYTLSYLAANVQTKVIDGIGNVVRTYSAGTAGPDTPVTVAWDLKDAAGNQVSPGTYYFQVAAAGATFKSEGFSVYARSEFGTGNGSPNAPYEISSLDLLQKVSGHRGACFKQTADIDVGRKPFLSLFTKDVPFEGVYDGGGFAIKNIISTKDSEENIAVFRAIGEKGTVQNLVIDTCTFNGKGNVSAIAGINAGNISNCTVKGCTFVASEGRAAGIVTENRGIVQDCRTEGNNINATSGNMSAGAICAYSNGTVISSSSKTDIIAVIAWNYRYMCAGGVVGYNEGSIVDCEVISAKLSGTRGGSTYGGGVAGYNSGTVSSCKIRDLTVEGSWNATGGVIGQNKAINDENDYDGSGGLNQVGTN